MKRILIIGATSAIAEAAARLWAHDGNHLYLLARNEERLNVIAADLTVRGAQSVYSAVLDVNDFARHQSAIGQAITTLEGIDLVLIAHGSLSNQKACETDFALALEELKTNAISVISLLTILANHFEAQKHGTIAVISSVAGDRGRQSNYIYGTAKGAVSIFLQGLRQRLAKSSVHVLTVKPGFVDTPMTKDFKKGILWASDRSVAKSIYLACASGREEIYAPRFWKAIMWTITAIPEKIFKRLSL